MADSDRTVHAEADSGVQLVRYDRSGKWWLEHKGDDPVSPARVPVRSINQAVAAALLMDTVYLDRPGGRAFSTKIRRGRG